jgi:hypothetical protein
VNLSSIGTLVHSKALLPFASPEVRFAMASLHLLHLSFEDTAGVMALKVQQMP